MNNRTTLGAGTIFVILLQLAFIVLKLCNVITWSWVFVLMPLIVLACVWTILLAILVISLIVGSMDND